MGEESSSFDSAAHEILERFLGAFPEGERAEFEAWAAGQEDLESDGELLARVRVCLDEWIRGSALAASLLPWIRAGGFHRPGGLRGSGAAGDDGHSGPALGLGVGTRVAHYRLLRFIAKGGMGEVWEALDEDLRRKVALKFVRPERVDARSLARFTREARAGGRLAHPSIVTTLAHGTDGGRAWIAQELVEGSWTLKNFLDELRAADAVPKGYYRKVAELVAQLADALQAAHDAGVIHRDVKPQNILIAPDEVPKLTDFGLARLTDDSFLSVSGDIAGTYAYMSPEQVTAKRMGLDHRSDVFSLGIVLYELLSLRRPFEGDTTHQIAEKILHLDPPEPSRIRSQCPRELSVICGKALEKLPDRRYQTMADFAADLRRHLANEPILAKPPGPLTRALKWTRRNPGLSSAAGVGGLALVVVSGLLIANVRTSRALARSNADLQAQTSLAELRARETAEQARIAQENATLAEANAETARLAQLHAEARTADVLSLSAQKDLDDLVARAERLWPPYPELLPEYERWLAEAQVLLEGRPADPDRGVKPRPSLAEHQAKLAELIAQAELETDDTALSRALEHASYPALVAARAERRWMLRMLEQEAWPDLAEVKESLEQESLPAEHHELLALARTLIGPEPADFDQVTRGWVLAARALNETEEASLSRAMLTLAWAEARMGRLEEALSTAERALEAGAYPALEQDADLLRTEVARWYGEARGGRDQDLPGLTAKIAGLEVEVGERRYGDPEARWWHVQLSKLVADLEALRDPEKGLMSETVAEPFGWGVGKRLEFARTIGERSVEGPEAKRRWAEAIAAIASSPQYGGLALSPQMGLLPIGADPESGLWEFAHLMTGDAPQRGADGNLVLTEEMGIVLVLIPGGSFWMGAQKEDQSGRNFDPAAQSNESPPHEAELSPYFLSKYEMTQAQWRRVAARNPSYYQPPGGPAPSLLHPVEQTSWDDCRSMMYRIALSLPSEAQWEHGARGGTDTPWWTGAERESLREKRAANLADQAAARGGATWLDIQDWPELDDGYAKHAPVGSFSANPLGLHEVHGNVWEWCLDGYSDSAYRNIQGKDPVLPWPASASRVFRGGCFFSAASYARSAGRSGASPEARLNVLGLRPSKGIT